jgi:large repetitive protein
VPDADRGSNFILKLDERSLPSGYRVTTENPRVQRLTRGKIAKFNFGVTLHRIVRLDLADQAFEYGGTTVQTHWSHVLDDLLAQLREQPSILRITYLAENESEALVEERVAAIRELIATRWHELNCCYDLKIEIEYFWRTGSPE